VRPVVHDRPARVGREAAHAEGAEPRDGELVVSEPPSAAPDDARLGPRRSIRARQLPARLRD
jgi:hypothetical protein